MKESIVGLFPQECVFLDKVCDNITHDMKLTKAFLTVFAVGGENGSDGKRNRKLLYYRVISDNIEAIDVDESLRIAELFAVTFAARKVADKKTGDEISFYSKKNPHVLSCLDLAGHDEALCVDVSMYGSNSKQGFMSLVMGVTEALALFRCSICSSTFYRIGEDVKKEPPVTTHAVINAVATWLNNDEDFQLFREVSAPYIRGYFEKPDLLGMGADMIKLVKKSLNECAAKQNQKGSFMIEICPYEKQIRRAFGDIVDEDDSISTTTKIIKNFKMNNSGKHIVFGKGERYEITLKFCYYPKKDKAGKEHLADFSFMIWSEQINELEYRISITKAIVLYVELWNEITSLFDYDFEIIEQKFKF